MGRTGIEWATHSWNPGIYGCSEVSPACANCYAAGMAHRLVGMGRYPAGITTRRASGVHWSGHVEVAKEVSTGGLPKRGPARVFTTSMGDLFHEDVPFVFVDDVFRVIRARPQLTFLLLTKRPGRMATYVERRVEQGLPAWPSNAWAGATVEDQVRIDERVPPLLRVPAPVRFLSCEPLLGPVDLDAVRPGRIHWVIAGGESGPRARPTDPAWFRSLRDQCLVAGVPFFFKQWGEWGDAEHIVGLDLELERERDALRDIGSGAVIRLGRRATGRELDGRTWDEVPPCP